MPERNPDPPLRFAKEMNVILFDRVYIRDRPIIVMKSVLLPTLAWCSIAILAHAAPRLVLSTGSLVPESKIDFVFEKPVVPPAAVGTTVENDWVVIDPPIAGKLRWKTPEIAELIDMGLPGIGATHTFSVAADCKHLDGSKIEAGRFGTAKSEMFRPLRSRTENRWRSSYVASTAPWMIGFNDEVDPAAVVPFVSFVSKEGQKVDARVRLCTPEQAGYLVHSCRPWRSRGGGAADAASRADGSVPNVIVVEPASPLPPGSDWNLVLGKGIPNADASARTGSANRYRIGSIPKFELERITPVVIANEPRRITLRFNHPLPDPLPEGLLESGIRISPRPEDLTAEVDGKQLHLRGDLLGRNRYQVKVKQDALRSATGFPLVKGATTNLRFEHLNPIVALPSEDSGQLANGRRKYRVFSQNLAGADIRIKKLAGTDLIRAYQGYRHFSGNGPDRQAMKPRSIVPFPMVAGPVVANVNLDFDNPVDTTRVVTLDWNKVLPGDLVRGALFIDARGKPRAEVNRDDALVSQAIVQLTDIGLAWKLNGKEAFIYAFSCDTGRPLDGVKLQLFGEDAAELESADTGEDGVARLSRPEAARHLLATLGDDSYVTAFDASMETVGMWHFPVRYSWGEPLEETREAFLFTDRSLYRPGETVRLKGIVRKLRGNEIVRADPAKARLIILDPAEKEIYNQPVEISADGSFDFTHQLAPSKTGTHEIRLVFPEDLKTAHQEDPEMNWLRLERIKQQARFVLPLRVEEFRRNAFEITQTIQPPSVAPPSVTVDLKASYYQGQPVAAGSVLSVSNVMTRNPYPQRFRDFQFGNHRTYDWGYWYHYFGYRDYGGGRSTDSRRKVIEDKLSADGTATVSVEIPAADFPSMRELTVMSEVTDANLQTLTATSKTIVHPASAYLGVSRIDRLVRAGEPLELRVVAVDTGESPFDRPLEVTATLTRQVNSAVKTRNGSGAVTTRNDTSEEAVSTTTLTVDPAESAKEGTSLQLAPTATGLHFLTLRGTDPEGRPIETVTRFHVYGTDEYPWRYEDGLRVKLVAEKKLYQPGETARVLVLSPIEGTAIVTVEREKVLRSFRTELKADNPVVEIPLSDDDAPNAFVSVLVVKGAGDSAREFKAPQLRLGYCELTIENRRERLAVTMDAGSESYRPGDEVTVNGRVVRADGKPLAGCEVTFFAEDEGTLAVMGYETPDPMKRFYQPRNLDVRAGVSFDSFVAENPEEQTFNLKGLFVGGGGDLSALADKLRKNFDPCAAWAPALKTGADGNFSHTFTLPDTLTRYRLIAVAHDGAACFGHVESSVVARKDIMLEPKAPRFAHQSDTVETRVLVQNSSEYAGTWEVRFVAHAAGGTPVCRAAAGVAESVTLQPGGSASLTFPAIAEQTGEAVFQWQAVPVSLQNAELTPALRRRLSDSVENRFQVEYPMPLLRQVEFVHLGPSDAPIDLTETLKRELLDGTGTIELELSRSQLSEAGGSVRYLLHYPYGCVEQTTSSLIPWCSVEKLRPFVPALGSYPTEQVDSALQAGAERLLSMQLPDGSFTYWPGDTERVDWATPYAGLGLVLASRAGAEVPESAISSLQQALIKSLRGIDKRDSPYALETDARALLVLALAGNPQVAYQNKLIDRLPDLTRAGRAMLAAAVASGNPDDPRRFDTAREILASKVSSERKYDGWMRWRSEPALELIAWASIDPKADETSKAFDRLLNDRNPYGHWRTTWCNGWSLVAMSMLAEHQNAGGSVAVEIEGNDGRQVVHLSPDKPTAVRSFDLGPNLKLAATCDDKAFVRLRVASRPAIAPIQPVASNGLAVDRIYELVKPDGMTEPLTEPAPGDLVRVTLRVTLPDDGSRYLVIEDPLPSVFETVNRDFESQRSAVAARTSENDWRVSHSELRRDRAVFFLDYIPRRGTYEVSYLARCTLAGEAVAPPAKVEWMYDPETFALSASRSFVAR